VRGPGLALGTRDQAHGQSLAAPGYRVADVEHALAGLRQLPRHELLDDQRLTQTQGLPGDLAGPLAG